jgi:hypothetical protein
MSLSAVTWPSSIDTTTRLSAEPGARARDDHGSAGLPDGEGVGLGDKDAAGIVQLYENGRAGHRSNMTTGVLRSLSQSIPRSCVEPLTDRTRVGYSRSANIFFSQLGCGSAKNPVTHTCKERLGLFEP